MTVIITFDPPPLEPVLDSNTLLEPIYRDVEPIGWLFENAIVHGKVASLNSPTIHPSAAQQKRTTPDLKKVVVLKEGDKDIDWYNILEIEPEECTSMTILRTAYKKRCLETHPDKQPDKSDESFKLVQRAMEILSHPESRCAYDSSRPFDDTVPSETVAENDFFKEYTPCFRRNSKFSTHNPVPILGTLDTPIHQVKKFYEFWLAFRSWRNFSSTELNNIDESMCREEKRFLQHENQRVIDKLKREEAKRVRSFVDRAMKLDPRLRLHREQEEVSRHKIKEEKELLKQTVAAETRRLKALSMEKLEENPKFEDPKIVKRNAMKEIVDYFKENCLIDTTITNQLLLNCVRQLNVMWFAQNASLDNILLCRDKVVASAVTCIDGSVEACVIFNEEINALEERLGRNRYGEQTRAPLHTDPTKCTIKKIIWSVEDCTLLHKATVKYPGGCHERWDRISSMLHNKFSEEQVIFKVKELEQQWKHKPPAVATSDVENWDSMQQKHLEAMLRQFKEYKERDKFHKVAAGVDGKTAKQCLERFKYLCSLRK